MLATALLAAAAAARPHPGGAGTMFRLPHLRPTAGAGDGHGTAGTGWPAGRMQLAHCSASVLQLSPAPRGPLPRPLLPPPHAWVVRTQKVRMAYMLVLVQCMQRTQCPLAHERDTLPAGAKTRLLPRSRGTVVGCTPAAAPGLPALRGAAPAPRLRARSRRARLQPNAVLGHGRARAADTAGSLSPSSEDPPSRRTHKDPQ
jgi:hypothetical protein